MATATLPTPASRLKELHREKAPQLSANELAKTLGISPMRITGIVKHGRAVTVDTAIRLGIFFGTGPRYWLDLQADKDLAESARSAAMIQLTVRTAEILAAELRDQVA